jgi:hypothetical protein
MMARQASVASLLLAVPVIAFGGCGGDDDSSSNTSSGSTNGQQGKVKAQNGPTGATGTTSPPPTRTARPDKSSSGGAGAPTVPTQTVPTSPPGSTQEEKPAKPKAKDIKYPKLVGRELAKQARVVCHAIPLDQLVETYKPKSSSPEDVSQAYAARYPVSLRKAVAAGCKAGLLESK